MSTPLLAAALLAGLSVGLALLPGARADARANARSGNPTTSRTRQPSGAPGGSDGHGGLGPDRHPPGSRSGHVADLGPPREPGSGAGSGTGPLMVRAVSALAGGAVWLLLGGPMGGALGVVVALVLPVLIARLEPAGCAP